MKASQTLGQQRTAFESFLMFRGDQSFDADDFMWLIDWRAYSLPYCSVYIITPDNKWPCKIGVSVNPEKRLKSLQTSVWRPLQVSKCFCCASIKEAKDVEAKSHRMLTEMNKWLHGEWFDMRPEQAAEIVEYAANIVGVECSDKIPDETIRSEVWQFVQESKVDNANFVNRVDTRIASGNRY